MQLEPAKAAYSGRAKIGLEFPRRRRKPNEKRSLFTGASIKESEEIRNSFGAREGTRKGDKCVILVTIFPAFFCHQQFIQKFEFLSKTCGKVEVKKGFFKPEVD
jgi:hypothetical protein